MFLFIDCREKEFISRLSASNVPNKIVALPVGDFVLSKSDTLDPDSIVYIIERKSRSDLLASIKDGRFREQKARMLESTQCPSKVVFIIQSEKSRQSQSQTPIFNGAIINLVFKHQHKVLFTNDDNDTFKTVMMLINKIEKGDIVSPTTSAEASAPKRICSKGDKIKETLTATLLSVIPGVSYNIGLVISKAFPSLHALFQAYANCHTEEEKLWMLANIQMTPKRKIGKSISSKVYQVLVAGI